MRSTLALAGVLAGAASFLAPVTSASAYCSEPVIVIEGQPDSGCTNGCMETGKAYEKARTTVEDKAGVAALPSYWDIFVCPM